MKMKVELKYHLYHHEHHRDHHTFAPFSIHYDDYVMIIPLSFSSSELYIYLLLLISS
jgi:hypothetical protein